MFPLSDPSAKGSKSVSGEGRALAGSSQSGGDFFQKRCSTGISQPGTGKGRMRDEAELGLRLSFSHIQDLT